MPNHELQPDHFVARRGFMALILPSRKSVHERFTNPNFDRVMILLPKKISRRDFELRKKGLENNLGPASDIPARIRLYKQGSFFEFSRTLFNFGYKYF
jgi:hypothetical protein